MDGKPRIGDTRMRRNLRAGIENRKEYSGRPRSHFAERCALKRAHGERATRNVRRLVDSLISQEISTPAARLVEFPPSVEGHSVGICDIWLETCAISHQDGGEFSSNVIGGGLN